MGPQKKKNPQLFLFPCINYLSSFKVYQHTKTEIIFRIKSDGQRKKEKFSWCINVWSASSRLNIHNHWHLFPCIFSLLKMLLSSFPILLLPLSLPELTCTGVMLNTFYLLPNTSQIQLLTFTLQKGQLQESCKTAYFSSQETLLWKE